MQVQQFWLTERKQSNDMAEHKLKDKTPWKTKDPAATIQKLVVHLGTPVLAAVVVMFSDISGRSGFLVTWLLMHLVTGGLLAKLEKTELRLQILPLKFLIQHVL